MPIKMNKAHSIIRGKEEISLDAVYGYEAGFMSCLLIMKKEVEKTFLVRKKGGKYLPLSPLELKYAIIEKINKKIKEHQER